MNVLDATRAWMRAQCPLINKQDLFNANYLGAEPTECGHQRAERAFV